MVFEVTGEQAMKPWYETSFAKIIPRTSDTKSFRFKKPDGFQHRAGQWMYVNIKVNDVSQAASFHHLEQPHGRLSRVHEKDHGQRLFAGARPHERGRLGKDQRPIR